MRVGERVRVVVNKDKAHKHTWASGTIAFVGSTDSAGGVWIGVKLDQAKGRNDGTVKNKRYFQAEKNEGIFVREKYVRVVMHDKSSHCSSKNSTVHVKSNHQRRSSPQKKSKNSPLSHMIKDDKVQTVKDDEVQTVKDDEAKIVKHDEVKLEEKEHQETATKPSKIENNTEKRKNTEKKKNSTTVITFNLPSPSDSKDDDNNNDDDEYVDRKDSLMSEQIFHKALNQYRTILRAKVREVLTITADDEGDDEEEKKRNNKIERMDSEIEILLQQARHGRLEIEKEHERKLRVLTTWLDSAADEFVNLLLHNNKDDEI